MSAPKSNQESQAAPRMLKFILTDGHTHIQAVEIGNNQNINPKKLAPGTKIRIKNAKVKLGYVFLATSSIEVLGGKVSPLYEKWELANSLLIHHTSSK